MLQVAQKTAKLKVTAPVFLVLSSVLFVSLLLPACNAASATEFGVQAPYLSSWSKGNYMNSLKSIGGKWVRLALRPVTDSNFWLYCDTLKANGIKIVGTMGSGMKGSAYTSLSDWSSIVAEIIPKCIGVIDVLEVWN